MALTVEIQFKDKLRPTRKQYYVKNTWSDETFFCLRSAYMVVHKYPLADIARVKEISDPNPGVKPDSNQIRRDFGYPE